MLSPLPITALRVANEAFLVNSTIERCPKTMMLRELVTNALESAAAAPEGHRRVEIGALPVEGARKLRIWNTGPGMSAAELHRICDLASSLHKQNALDRNFGMGAKVASLPSNKHGLRYRSCRDGVVSEVTMGQRGGIYGRIPYRVAGTPVESEVADVTEQCRAEGGYDLSADWTEVLLCGNRAEQDTLRDPYDRDPVVEPHWVLNYLHHRFHTLPDGLTLRLLPGVAGAEEHLFTGLAPRLDALTRRDSVAAMEGIRIHFAYDAREDAGTAAEPDGTVLSGQAAIVHRGEVYAARRGQDWVMDAPSFGMPFGAKHFTVLVELPDDYPLRPDLYRQFLRFQHGGQRQVMLSDFAAVVRAAIPAWLRDIIASYGPPQADYMSELEGELQDLLVQLGITAQPRGPRPVAAPRPAAEPATPPAPRPPRFEVPPEIVQLREPAQIDEKGLQGRAARFYPQAHQIFVNLTYSAFVSMAMELEHAFEAAPGGELKPRLARELAEWAISRKISRAIVYSLGKRTIGWKAEEIDRAQSPEALSIAADDFAVVLEPARRRMAEMLGIETPGAAEAVQDTAFLSLRDRRLASDLVDAQQAARRALQTPEVNAAPILRRVSAIEMQRRNWDTALEWARQAIAADQGDAASFLHLAGLLTQRGELDGAEAAVAEAEAADPRSAMRAARQRSVIAAQRRDIPGAVAWARRAVQAEPDNAAAHSFLAAQLLQQDAFEEAGAALDQALALDPHHAPRVFRLRSMVAQRQRDLPRAVDWAHQAVDAEPMDAQLHNHLAGLLLQQGELDAAEDAAFEALRLGTGDVSAIRRQIEAIAARKQSLQAAD
ncbi:ATP-binding protein [Roseomonas haemaphysalidis]|uniref:Tetratricopeptide repeat protein n=1 Tax=Roseomonas haemaphysalidis TaxID=2768162 RepID=A0ABS3KSM5_9PROT|nr:ATP-binding protein [Roseomonas haemaphysalidis]MBO1080468.1 tetratricopeptide repeat protein [Roseomonas haemaphysalidis]